MTYCYNVVQKKLFSKRNCLMNGRVPNRTMCTTKPAVKGQPEPWSSTLPSTKQRDLGHNRKKFALAVSLTKIELSVTLMQIQTQQIQFINFCKSCKIVHYNLA